MLLQWNSLITRNYTYHKVSTTSMCLVIQLNGGGGGTKREWPGCVQIKNDKRILNYQTISHFTIPIIYYDKLEYMYILSQL